MNNMVEKKIFIVCFFIIIVVPLFGTNLKSGVVSKAEKRFLTEKPRLYNEDNSINKNFASDFENWFNDNIGLRSFFVTANADIQYYIFNLLANNSDMYLGPHGELNYATEAMIQDYQRFNYWGDDHLQETSSRLQYLSDYVENYGGQFYYYQCWDKHSIYPEQFPTSIIQTAELSNTDRIINAYDRFTSVNIINPKETLIKAKSEYPIYSIWGDASHWSQRGAYVGYLELMHSINENNNGEFMVLGEQDYNISLEDQGEYIFGGIHEKDILEKFEIKDRKAYQTNEKLTLHNDDPRSGCLTNDDVNNKKRVLIIGDSYFADYIVDDLAESFYEVFLIRNDFVGEIGMLLDEYSPDIVILEAAERYDRTWELIYGVNQMNPEW